MQIEITLAGSSRRKPLLWKTSRTVIIVLDADDIIFAEIAAGLHLDQFEIDLAGIFQPMPDADRHIDRIRFHAAILLSVADRHPRRAAHHDPVLGAMMMQLQRQPPARLHHDALDLIAIAHDRRD